MSQRFYKGRTNNHLTFAMVDATDFATPESALSAAIKIKIYGKLRSATGVNFVSSGTGSLTNDIVHVGASALGLYTIALAKADLSDASAAWYDQYIIPLSATGAAYQVLVVDGGIDLSQALAAASNAESMLVVGTFALGASNLSDVGSRVLAVLGATPTASDIASKVWSDYQSKVGQTPSQVYSNISNMLSYISGVVSGLGAGQSASAIADKVWSDYASKVGVTASQAYSYLSATVSGLGAGQSASAIADKVWSDFQSKAGASPSQVYSVLLIGASAASDAASAAAQGNSRVLLVQSRLSDLDSRLASDVSDLYSLLSDHHSTLGSQFAVTSNYLSYLSAVVSTLGAAPTASAVADKVWSDFQSKAGASPSQLYSVALLGASAASDAASAAAQANSRVLLVQSRLSDLDSRLASDISDVKSALSDFQSDFQSRVPKAVATASYLTEMSAVLSDTYSAFSDFQSDFQSRVPKAVATNSQLAGVSATLSDVYSLALDAFKGKEHFNKSTGEYTKYKIGGATGWSHLVSSDATSVVRGEGA